MPRRNVIPFALLAVLAVLAGVFAVLAASSAPDTATLAVQNATGETFGSPTGSVPFSMNLINSLSAGPKTGTLTQVRLVDYVAPNRMAVYQPGHPPKLIAVLNQAAITCALEGYTAIVGGTTPWVDQGSSYGRTESLATYSARVPHPIGTTCAPRPTVVHGTVSETATVRSGYLVTLHLVVKVPPQTLAGGTEAAHGVEGETLKLLQINGTPVSSLG